MSVNIKKGWKVLLPWLVVTKIPVIFVDLSEYARFGHRLWLCEDMPVFQRGEVGKTK